MRTSRTNRKAARVPIQIPPKARRCVKVERPKSAFHSASFRYVKSGSAVIMVGCPKRANGKATRFKSKVKAGCRVGSRKAGLRAHAVIKAARTCPTGYKRK